MFCSCSPPSLIGAAAAAAAADVAEARPPRAVFTKVDADGAGGGGDAEGEAEAAAADAAAAAALHAAERGSIAVEVCEVADGGRFYVHEERERGQQHDCYCRANVTARHTAWR